MASEKEMGKEDKNKSEKDPNKEKKEEILKRSDVFRHVCPIPQISTLRG